MVAAAVLLRRGLAAGTLARNVAHQPLSCIFHLPHSPGVLRTGLVLVRVSVDEAGLGAAGALQRVLGHVELRVEAQLKLRLALRALAVVGVGLDGAEAGVLLEHLGRYQQLDLGIGGLGCAALGWAVVVRDSVVDLHRGVGLHAWQAEVVVLVAGLEAEGDGGGVVLHADRAVEQLH